MAKRGHHQFAARKREQDRKERAAKKRERKEQRVQTRTEPGVDADLAGIVPGPQPRDEASDAEVQRAQERAMRPGGGGTEPRPLSPAKAAACRLFVGNLDPYTDDHSLRRHFLTAGHEVTDASVVTDRQSGESRGFAFVELSSPDAARKAVAEMDGVALEGRPLRIRLATERPPTRR